MKKNGYFFLLISILFFTSVALADQKEKKIFEINTTLMRATFKIEGKGSQGTVFFLGKRTRKDPQKAYFVLITAAHVLKKMKGDKANLFLREVIDGGTFKKLKHEIPIRDDKGKELWVEHPDADVAAMYVTMPKNAHVNVIPDDHLITENAFKEWEIHPGDELLCLGYPFGASANEAGFPILRSGKIASYPLVPTKVIKTFLFDFEVFPGNSGGPVYMAHKSRFYKGKTHLGELIQCLVGLVTEYKLAINLVKKKAYNLNLGVVIHACLIKETFDLLPEHPLEKK